MTTPNATVPPTVTGAAGSQSAGAATNAGTATATNAGQQQAAAQSSAAAAGVGTSQQAAPVGAGARTEQMIPYSRFQQVVAQNRAMQQLLQQRQNTPAAPVSHAQAPAAPLPPLPDPDAVLVKHVETRLQGALKPIMDRVAKMNAYIEQQEQMQTMERGQRLIQQIEQRHPIFAEQTVIGRAAKMDFQQRLVSDEAQYRTADEIAEEVAAMYQAEKQQFEASVMARLSAEAIAKSAAAATAGASVTSGGGVAPVTPTTQKPKNVAEAGRLYRESLASRQRGVAGTA